MDRKLGKRPLRHHSFILSLWAESGPYPGSPPVWRYSLEDPHSSERRGFKDLSELLHYLQDWEQDPPTKADQQ